MNESKQKLIEHWEGHIRELVAGEAQKLRRIADELDREAEHSRDSYQLVQSAIRTVAWGVANLNQSTLASWLQQIDSLRNAAEVEQEGNDV